MKKKANCLCVDFLQKNKMAEEVKKTKKLEELKETAENKKAVAEDKGEKLVTDNTDSTDSKKVESKPAVEKSRESGKKGKEKKGEVKAELEREYIVPMRKGFMNVPHYRRAKKAVKTLKEFMVRHMNIRDGDLRKVKVDIHLNNEIWFRGIKKPLSKIKVRAKKVDDIVYVTLSEPADYVKFKMAREAKAVAEAKVVGDKKQMTGKTKEKVDADKDKDGVDDKVEEKEDVKSEAEKDAKVAKIETKDLKHSVEGKHKQKIASTKGLK